MTKLTRHVRSNVVGYVALFFAVGIGSSWAATELSKNEVKSKHIKNGAVKEVDLANNAVNAAKVANGSLLSEDFAAGQLPAGPPGDQGPPGEDATNLFAYVSDVNSANPAVLEYGKGAVSVDDPAGENSYATPYVVTFDRSLQNCVSHATVGFGDPLGSGVAAVGPMMATISGSTVATFSFNTAGQPRDTSFMLSVFC